VGRRANFAGFNFWKDIPMENVPQTIISVANPGSHLRQVLDSARVWFSVFGFPF
jgi:hypothetical protein